MRADVGIGPYNDLLAKLEFNCQMSGEKEGER